MPDVSKIGTVETANISKVGTQPIIGTQIYFKFEDTVGLLPLIALNEKGYKRIIELSSKSFLFSSFALGLSKMSLLSS